LLQDFNKKNTKKSIYWSHYKFEPINFFVNGPCKKGAQISNF
jgi:hypothetical protein